MTISAALLQDLFALRDNLTRAKHGSQSKLVAEFADFIGRTPATVYDYLKKHAGWESGRKKRADAGRCQLSNATLDFIASAQREAVRANGKRTMPIAVALDVAAANGHEINVSANHVRRVLRQRRMDVKRTMAARNHIELRSPHPNYMHQIDPSLCLIFYMHGKQWMMRDDAFYKNKLDAIARIKLKVWRYVRYDHFSGEIDVRYYEAAGESQAALFDFLMWTWGKQDGRVSFGVPKVVLWDKGSANTAHGVQNMCAALDIEAITHFAGHPWAKGGIEVSNNITETQFESRLRFEPVDSVEQLNAAALAWCSAYNANLIPHVDSRLRRASGERLVRDDLWQTIVRYPGALVELPPVKVCKWFLHGAEQTRRVRDLKISFAHPELPRSAIYDLADWAEFLGQNMEVRVKPLLLREGAIRVEVDRLGEEPLLVEVEPVREFDASGRSLSAQMVGEGFSRAPETLDEATAKRLNAAAYGAEGATLDAADALRAKQARPFGHLNAGKGVVAHSHLADIDLPQRLLPDGAELDTPAVAAARATRVELAPLTLVEAAKAIKALIGEAWMPAVHFQWLRQRYPDGVPPEQIESIAANLQGPHGGKHQAFQIVKGGSKC
jgi:transposase InsO family protein